MYHSPMQNNAETIMPTPQACRPIASFTSLVCLPIIITAPGVYVTRGGEVVTVETSSMGHYFGCWGQYSCGAAEFWHRSGRLYFGCETQNDIVASANLS